MTIDETKPTPGLPVWTCCRCRDIRLLAVKACLNTITEFKCFRCGHHRCQANTCYVFTWDEVNDALKPPVVIRKKGLLGNVNRGGGLRGNGPDADIKAALRVVAEDMKKERGTVGMKKIKRAENKRGTGGWGGWGDRGVQDVRGNGGGKAAMVKISLEVVRDGEGEFLQE